MSADPLYFDHNATTPPLASVVDMMAETMRSHWANASSSHSLGEASKRDLLTARKQLSQLLGCRPAELVFTSGATEANHAAVWGALHMSMPARSKLVLSSVEHASHFQLAKRCASEQWMGRDVQVSFIPVRRDGSLDSEAALKLMGEDVALVSVMAANNETGVLMPVAELTTAAHACGALMHVDATQVLGKLPFDFASSGVDLVSVSAHKLHGPKGVGALLVRQGLKWPAWVSGSQERGRRGGTENTPAILGFALAAQEALADANQLAVRAQALAKLRDRLEQGLKQAFVDVEIYGEQRARLPNTSLLRFGPLPAEQVLQKLDKAGLVASSGSACSASGTEPSHVLLAMGVPADEALGAVRLSLGSSTTAAEIETAISLIVSVVQPLLDQEEQRLTQHSLTQAA